MPRSRTRNRPYAAKLAAGLAVRDPEKTVGRMRHWWRRVWKRFAWQEQICGDIGLDRRARRLAILARINKWIDAAMAEEEAGQAKR